MYDVFLMLQRFLKQVYVYSTNQTKTENFNIQEWSFQNWKFPQPMTD